MLKSSFVHLLVNTRSTFTNARYTQCQDLLVKYSSFYLFTLTIFLSVMIFATVMVILILILMCFNSYNFIEIISCNVGSHSEHITEILMLTWHCISLLFV